MAETKPCICAEDNRALSPQRKKNLGLLIASLVGHTRCAEICIKEGADVNCSDEKLNWDRYAILCARAMVYYDPFDLNRFPDWTPLICAARNGHLQTVKMLIEAGTDVNLKQHGATSLAVAADKGHYKCVEFLIEAGANVNVTNPSVTPPLIYAARKGDTDNNRKIIELLIKAGAEVNYPFPDVFGKKNILLDVVSYGSPRILSMLVEAGADVNMKEGHLTPLLSVAIYGKIEFLRPLVDAGADVNHKDDLGKTALHRTVTDLDSKTSNVLIELGANVNIVDNERMTPLLLIARCCAGPQWRLLQDDSNSTEFEAFKTHLFKQICTLFKAGAEIGRRDRLGRNSLEISVHQNQKNVKDIHMLLYAAGETLDGPTVPVEDYSTGVNHAEIPAYFKQLKEKLDLKHLCREAIRKHLIDLDSHEHLFGRIPQLGLPSTVTEYMLYDCSLDPKQ